MAAEALPLAVSLAWPIKAKGMESPPWLDPKPTGRVSAAHGGWVRVAEMGGRDLFQSLTPTLRCRFLRDSHPPPSQPLSAPALVG